MPNALSFSRSQHYRPKLKDLDDQFPMPFALFNNCINATDRRRLCIAAPLGSLATRRKRKRHQENRYGRRTDETLGKIHAIGSFPIRAWQSTIPVTKPESALKYRQLAMQQRQIILRRCIMNLVACQANADAHHSNGDAAHKQPPGL